MRNLLLIAALVVTPQLAQAKRVCGPVMTMIDTVAMTSSRSFSWKGVDNRPPALSIVWVEFVDANASITRLRATCTVSPDDNSTDYTPQECPNPSGGICLNGGLIDKGDATTGSGSINYPIRLYTDGYPDLECTWSTSGTPAAADTIRVKLQLC